MTLKPCLATDAHCDPDNAQETDHENDHGDALATKLHARDNLWSRLRRIMRKEPSFTCTSI